MGIVSKCFFGGRLPACAITVLMLCACLAGARAQESPVRFVHEVPWTIRANGIAGKALPIVAYWEAELGKYYVALPEYFALLGFHVAVDSVKLRASRPSEHFVFDGNDGTGTHGADAFALDSTDFFVSEGALYVSFGGLQKIFPPATIQFDRSRFQITHSAAAPVLPSAPFESDFHTFGRSRSVLGSMRLDYRLTRTQWREYDAIYHGFFRTTTNALGGRIKAEGLLSRLKGELDGDLRTLGYLLDFPGANRLTQVEAGRLNFYGWPMQTTYDGVRISNLPVAGRFVQRTTALRGVADPGAVVSANVGGMVVDRVQADPQGRYVLQVPVYYGSSSVQVEIAPAGGGPVSTRSHQLFVIQDMPQPGKLYWDVRAGRESFEPDSLMAFAEVRYGLLPGLAARAAYLPSGAPLVGMIKSWRGVAAESEVVLPREAVRVRLWAYGRSLRLQAEGSVSETSAWSLYRRHISSHLGWDIGRGSFFLQAAHGVTFSDYTSTMLASSATASLSNTTSALLTIGMSQYRLASQVVEPWELRWGVSLSRAVTHSVRVALLGDGGLVNELDFVGGSAHGTWRWGSLGLRAGYGQGLVSAITMRINAPWASITNRSSIDAASTISHSQSIYGSMELGRVPRLSRQSVARTGAVLQAFLDVDRNGRRDAGEAYLDHVDIQVPRAQLREVRPGRMRADLLVPHQHYEVTVDTETLRSPRLVLPLGEQFSFVADPGQTKRIDIPVEQHTIIDGVIEAMPRYSATRLVVVFVRDGVEVARADVSQERRFSARLAPGAYAVMLEDRFGRMDFSGYSQQVEILDRPEQAVQLTPLVSSDER